MNAFQIEKLDFLENINTLGWKTEDLANYEDIRIITMIFIEPLDENNNIQISVELLREIQRLVSVDWLKIGNGSITGTIPPELGNLLTNLRILQLNNNKLTGTIPSQLVNLQNLEQLDLYDNELTGTIPIEFGDLQNLEYLDLHDNNLTGHIPLELGNLANLRALYLNNNQLTGTIPVELGKLQNLEILDLNTNLLTGVVPLSLSRISGLNVLNLGNNTIKKLQHGTEILGDYEGQQEITELFNEILGQTYGLKSLYKIDNPQIPTDVVKHGVASNLFGKIIKPYKKQLYRVDDKGAYFNTRFGVQKLRDDERGLYLKNGKGVRLYLYEW